MATKSSIRTIDVDDDGVVDAVVINTNGDTVFINPKSIKKIIKYVCISITAVIAGITGHSVIL